MRFQYRWLNPVSHLYLGAPYPFRYILLSSLSDRVTDTVEAYCNIYITLTLGIPYFISMLDELLNSARKLGHDETVGKEKPKPISVGSLAARIAYPLVWLMNVVVNHIVAMPFVFAMTLISFPIVYAVDAVINLVKNYIHRKTDSLEVKVNKRDYYGRIYPGSTMKLSEFLKSTPNNRTIDHLHFVKIEPVSIDDTNRMVSSGKPVLSLTFPAKITLEASYFNQYCVEINVDNPNDKGVSALAQLGHYSVGEGLIKSGFYR